MTKMTTKNPDLATLLPLLRAKIEESRLALDAFESRLGDGVTDDAAIGKLGKALFVANLAVKQVQSSIVEDSDWVYLRSNNFILANNEV